jgi:8-oxo-dGTP diphosphatase
MKKVSAAVIVKEGMILIARRSPQSRHQPGKWELPGGKVEQHETPEESLKRELYEEFGIEAEVGSFICSSTYTYTHGGIELAAYWVSHLSGEFVLHDHDEIRWVTPAEMGEYDFAPADIPIVQRLQSGECFSRALRSPRLHGL